MIVPISPLSSSLGFSCSREDHEEGSAGESCIQSAPSPGSHRKTWKSHITEVCSPLQLTALPGTHNEFITKITARKWTESESDPGYVESSENTF